MPLPDNIPERVCEAKQQPEEIWAILPAGGSSSRFSAGNTALENKVLNGTPSGNKLLALLNGKPVFAHTLSVFLNSPLIKGIIVPVHPSLTTLLQHCVESVLTDPSRSTKPLLWVAGGATRRESVYRGLQALPCACTFVVVHDAARPLVTEALLFRAFQPLKQKIAQAVVVGIPCTDTLKQVDSGQRITTTVDRAQLWQAQTPQVFEKALLLKAHQLADPALLATDDAQLLEVTQLAPACMVLGCETNLKITTPLDLMLAEGLLLQRGVTPLEL
jgi:2-C-methyl-D-erythritol 4-phosphate cytidylyltransferase